MNKKGISLAELLAVVVIMGIVAAIAITLVGNTISHTKDKAKIADVQSYVSSIETFQMVNNLPDSDEPYKVVKEGPILSDKDITFTAQEVGIIPKGTDFSLNFYITDGRVSIVIVTFVSGTTYTYSGDYDDIVVAP